MPRHIAQKLGAVASVVCGAALLAGAGEDSNRHHPQNASDSELASRAAMGSAASSDSPSPGERSQALSRDAPRQALDRSRDTALRAAAQRLRRAREDALARDARLSVRRDAELARKTAWVLPLDQYRVTSTFGSTGSLWSNGHTGLDLAAPEGTEIRSASAGTVREAASAGAYGLRTIVRTDGGVDLWYCHQSRLDVTTGQRLSPGQVIGAVGSTGNVTGPHLHLEVRPAGGDPVDPGAVLRTRGVAY